MPCKGIYVADAGIFEGEGLSDGFLITQIAGRPTTSIDDFGRIFLSLQDGARVGFRYIKLGGGDEEPGIVEIDHHFYSGEQFTRDGIWNRRVLTPNASGLTWLTTLRRAPTFNIQEARGEMFRNVLVMVQCRYPYSVEVILHQWEVMSRESENLQHIQGLGYWLPLAPSP
jgi:hypothetical protein